MNGRRFAVAVRTEAAAYRPVDGALIFPHNARLAQQWQDAVAWLRARPGGSRWKLDTYAPKLPTPRKD